MEFFLFLTSEMTHVQCIIKTPMSRIEEGLEYRINHFKLKFENLINFFLEIGGKNGVFLKNIHLWINQKKFLQQAISQLIFVMALLILCKV